MTSRRARIARLRQVAVAALGSYALPEGRLTFVSHGENTTFRHDSAAGRHLVRVHRHGAAMARLHDHADRWTPPPDFVRIRWDYQTFFEDVMIYGDTSAADCWA